MKSKILRVCCCGSTPKVQIPFLAKLELLVKAKTLIFFSETKLSIEARDLE